ncbi:MAG: EVE domain-containing protein [Dehalococcoidales bacterium]|nr:EVE domain-containing protein [Dehalococcoidales bacterium]
MNYWIIQSNPKYFDILRWLKEIFASSGDKALTDRYYISCYKPEVKPGDTVFIWKCKGNGNIRGIYAKGTVEPVPVPDKWPLCDKEREFCVGQRGRDDLEKMRRNRKTIAVKYISFHLNEREPLLEDEIKKKPELRDLTIFKQGEVRRGIHKVAPEKCRVIESLLSQHR